MERQKRVIFLITLCTLYLVFAGSKIIEKCEKKISEAKLIKKVCICMCVHMEEQTHFNTETVVLFVVQGFESSLGRINGCLLI